jgi:hypothetical protein
MALILGTLLDFLIMWLFLLIVPGLLYRRISVRTALICALLAGIPAGMTVYQQISGQPQAGTGPEFLKQTFPSLR